MSNAVSFEIVKNGRDGNTTKHTVLVSKKDYDRVSKHSWHVHNKKYVATVVFNEGKAPENYYLHRFILGNELNEYEAKIGRRAKIDFIDGNCFNCTRENLKIYVPKDIENEDSKIPKSSMYKNISFIRWSNRWRAKLTFQGQSIYEKQFKTEREAFDAVNAVKTIYNNRISAGEFGSNVEKFDVESWNGPTRPIEQANASVIEDEVAARMNDLTIDTIPVLVSFSKTPTNDVRKRLDDLKLKQKSVKEFEGAIDTLQIAIASKLPEVSKIKFA